MHRQKHALDYSQQQDRMQQQDQKYQYFSKSFRAELLYMEAVLRNDDRKKTGQQHLLDCFFSDPAQDSIEERAKKYNPRFCKAFKMMKPQEREIYYEQLNDLINLLQKEINHECHHSRQGRLQVQSRQELNLKQQTRQKIQKRLRNNLIKGIIPENFKSQIMKNMTHESFEVKMMIEGNTSEKVVEFDYFYVHFITKNRKNESKLMLGLRNYLLMSSDQRGFSHRLQSIYPTIQPRSVELGFMSRQQKDMTISYLECIIKIAKVQNLIRNYQIDQKIQIAAKQHKQAQNLLGVYSSVFDKSRSFYDSDDEVSESDDDISRVALHKSYVPDDKKKNQMKEQLYREMKKKLIETLIEIAEKKKKQNEKINQFINKHKRFQPICKSDAANRALADPENVLRPHSVYSVIVHIHKNECLKTNKIQSILDQQKRQSALDPKQKQNGNMNAQQSIDDQSQCQEQNAQHEDSFLSRKNCERQEYRKKTALHNRISNNKYEDNVYSSDFYPHRKISCDDNLVGYKRIMITRDIWELSEIKQQPTKESVKLKEKAENKVQHSQMNTATNKKIRLVDKNETEEKIDEISSGKGHRRNKTEYDQKLQFTQQTIEKNLQKEKLYETINRDCSLLHKNKMPTALKIFIRQPLQLRLLLSVIADVTTWHEWHPNITAVKLIKQDPSKNTCQVQMRCKVANRQFQYNVLVHFFSVEDRYYLVMKTLPKQESKQQGSFWNFLNFWRKNDEVKMEYLLIKILRSTTEGVSKLVIEFDLDRDNYRQRPKLMNEQVTMFLNFYFAHHYWKTIRNKIEALSQQEKKETHIKIQKGRRLFNDSLFRIDWGIDNAVMESKQHHWNRLTGQSA